MKNIFQFIKTSLIFSIAVFCFWAEFSQATEEAKKMCPVPPAPEEGSQPQVCFFALNGPDESDELYYTAIYEKLVEEGTIKKKENVSPEERKEELEAKGIIKRDGGVCSHCLSTEKVESAEKVRKCPEGDNAQVVKEFYACGADGAGGNVSRAFEKMTEQRCDGLVISGHHLGYYTGKKTPQEDRKVGSETLDLKFLEELSCIKEGDGKSFNCREWFSKIKYVHLHGSYTAGREIESGDFDQMVLDKMKSSEDSKWTANSSGVINREYASTVSQHNPLQSRYLRMFPKSLVFGYSGEALTIDQSSAKQIIDHMKALGSILSEKPDQLKSFLSWLGDTNEQSIIDDICDLWDGSNGNEVFRYDGDKGAESEFGCQLSEAIQNKNDIEKPLNNILDSCSDQSPCKLLHQNMNRIFAINNDHPDILKNLEPKQKKILLENLSTISLDKNSGFVNRANALYLQKQLGYESKDEEKEFFTYINTFYDSLEEDSSTEAKVYKEMLAEVIWKNNLGQTLEEENKDLVTGLIEKFKRDDFADQALLIRAATLSQPSGRGKKIINSLPRSEINSLDTDYIALQIKNKRYTNFHFLNDDKIDQKTYEDIVGNILDISLARCIKNPLQGFDLKMNDKSINGRKLQYDTSFNKDCNEI